MSERCLRGPSTEAVAGKSKEMILLVLDVADLSSFENNNSIGMMLKGQMQEEAKDSFHVSTFTDPSSVGLRQCRCLSKLRVEIRLG